MMTIIEELSILLGPPLLWGLVFILMQTKAWKYIVTKIQVKKKCKETIKRFQFDLEMGLFKSTILRGNEIYFFNCRPLSDLNKNLLLYVMLLSKLGYKIQKHCIYDVKTLKIKDILLKQTCNIGINKTTKTFWLYDFRGDKLYNSDVFDKVFDLEEIKICYDKTNENKVPEYLKLSRTKKDVS